MLVAKGIVGATLGGLATVFGAVAVFHVMLGDGAFFGGEGNATRRLLVAIALQIIVMLLIMMKITRPGSPRPLTWVSAMVGALAVGGLSLLVFGSVPHEMINFFDSELSWNRRDLIFIGEGGNLLDVSALPFNISLQALRDVIVAGLYTNSFAAALAFWLMWQRRFALADEAAAKKAAKGEDVERELVPGGTSAFGRPVSKEA